MPNDDMSEYLGVFLDEATEQLDLLERSVLELETEPTTELLQSIFRVAHTLKGSSRAMGFVSIGELTHAMEDVLDALRHDRIAVEHSVIDALFECLDRLKALKEQIAESGEANIETDDLSTRLRAMLAAPAPAAGTTAESHRDSIAAAQPVPDVQPAAQAVRLGEAAREAIRQAAASGLAVYDVTVTLAADCVMKSVRVMMVLQALDPAGTVIATDPDEEALDNEQFGLSFLVTLATERSSDEVRTLLLAVAEVAAAEIAPSAGLERGETAQADEEAGSGEAPRIAVVSESPAPGRSVSQGDAGPPAEAPAADTQERDASAPASAGRSVSQTPTIRVDVARLDNLLNLVGELVIDQRRVTDAAARLAQAQGGGAGLEQLHEAAAHFGRIASEMQDEIMKARMLPVGNVFSRFPRMVRDLAQRLGKQVDFVVVGSETELDRSVIEVIGDPLIHLLRNSVDHGIEPPAAREAVGKPASGTVWLRARHEENHIVIEVEDDGKGIDAAAVRASAVRNGAVTAEAAARMSDREALTLIFGSGVSTAATVTDVSGRGVGMDVVKNNLTRFGAILDLESEVGRGSRITIKLPLTLAIIRGLLVRAAPGVYALPLSAVLETVQIPDTEIHVLNGRELIVHRGATLPLLRLRSVFARGIAERPTSTVLHAPAGRASKYEAARSPALITDAAHAVAVAQQPMLSVIVVGVGQRRVGLVADSLVGEQEIVIKSLGRFIGNVRGISGATILGDGTIAFIVDIEGLIATAVERKVGVYAA